MKRITILPNINKDIRLETTKKLVSYLKNFDCTVNISRGFSQFFNGCEDLPPIIWDDRVHTDLYIILGGDGSIMRAARRAAPAGVPILGVNLGRVGYIAELEANEIEQIKSFFTGEYTIERRMMLDIRIKNENRIMTALNDAVISNGAVSRMVELELYCNSNPVGKYHADGIIASTPTGSTAYSMSAGGPIIDPKIDCICITPVCSHSLRARPMIFSADSVLEIKDICVKHDNMYLTVDGNENIRLRRGDVVSITKSAMTTKLIRMKKDGFYSVLNRKMSD